ncbi:UNVERIFIED_CONTAM: hypothetical protein GTU68_005050 [Idotea baltica]|nr:hypothetical protein [Idotea baltica]
MLKPKQVENRLLDKQRSILAIAGLGHDNMSARDVNLIFSKRITGKIVDLKTGEFTAKNPALSEKLSSDQDIAIIKRRERYTTIYLVKKAGHVDTVVLPIRGYGLWSTLYGFIALKNDLNTVVGLGFYQQGETPGLGGEVDNPKWKKQWSGKMVFSNDQKVILSVIKGHVNPKSPEAIHQVDGLSGATLTSKGVNNLVHFWLGENGFGPFITKFHKEGGV